MQTIETRYLGATAFRSSRIKATATNGKSKVSPWTYDGNDYDIHKSAAYALRDLMGWTGEMVGGHTKRGMVWVFLPKRNEK